MTKQKTRTYARNRSKSSELFSRKGRERIYDNDGSFFLKLVVFVILSALWLRLKNPVEVGGNFYISLNYIRISASTPAGKFKFCKLSIVFGVAFVMSIRRL